MSPPKRRREPEAPPARIASPPLAPAAEKPQVPSVIDTLRKVLEEAEKGNVIAAGIAYVTDLHQLGTGTASRGDPIAINLLKAAAHKMPLDLHEATKPAPEKQ